MSSTARPAGAGSRDTGRTGQRGGFVMGLVIGLLIGLALSLGVALYITKAPVPFINKVPQRTAEQDNAENERNRHWDPNAPLGGKGAARAVTPAASGAVDDNPAGALPPGIAPAPAPVPAAAPATRPPARDPAAILAGGGAASAPAARPPAAVATPAATAPAAAPGGFFFFVQAGAYTRVDDAEQQRARLALAGQSARITEREQVGRTVYRVRLGPFPTREEADALLGRLQSDGIEAQIVRVERP